MTENEKHFEMECDKRVNWNRVVSFWDSVSPTVPVIAEEPLESGNPVTCKKQNCSEPGCSGEGTVRIVERYDESLLDRVINLRKSHGKFRSKDY